jgi:hypothetical protein
MAHPVVTATLSVQGISTEVDVTDATQRFWLNGILFGNPVAQGAYNDSSHLTDSDDSNDVVIRNVKWFGTSQAEVDTILLSAYGSALYGEDQFGGTRANSNPVVIGLPLSQTVCQLHFHLASDIPIAISAAHFYAYDGISDTSPYKGITFYAAEAGQTTSWVAANGSSQALACSTQASSTMHDWFIAVSATPTTQGDHQGKIKFVYTYA